jgi:hypothetical protein
MRSRVIAENHAWRQSGPERPSLTTGLSPDDGVVQDWHEFDLRNEGSMRKSKEIKGKRVLAGLEYKRGNRKEAYKMWAEANTEMDELRGRNKPVAKPTEPSAGETSDGAAPEATS